MIAVEAERTGANRREFLVGGALLASGAASLVLANAATPLAMQTAELKSEIPARIGGWTFRPGGSDLIPQGEGGGEEVYDQIVSRHYRSEAEPPVMLLIAYGSAQSGSTQLHRPEVCYPAAGFRIIERPDIALSVASPRVIRTRNLTAIASGRVEQIVYWSRVGKDFPGSGFDQRWSILRQTLVDGIPDGVLVRISTIEADPTAGVQVLRRFAAALASSGGPGLRHLLWGEP